MKTSYFVPLTLLCALAVIPRLESSAHAADDAATPTTKAEFVMPSVIKDDNDLRTIEVVTDRNETVAQFFGRQRLVLIDNMNSDGKPVTFARIVRGEVPKFFTSYPLQNDQNFVIYRYGDYFQLTRPEPAVATAVAGLFDEKLKLDWNNTMLILAPNEKNSEDGMNKKAQLVGRIFIKNRDQWRPEMDAETLKYRGSGEKTEPSNP